jgi:thymidine phosphorylase
MEIGLAAVSLGAGRTRADQAVDPTVGVLVHQKPGARVAPGTLLAEVQAKDAASAAPVATRVRRAFRIEPDGVPPRPLLLGRVVAGVPASGAPPEARRS